MDIEWLLASRGTRAEHVERHAGDDRGQPASEILDLARAGTADPEPRVLNGVVRFRQRAEHSVGHRTQPRTMLLEALGQPLLIRHVTFLRRHGSYLLDPP